MNYMKINSDLSGTILWMVALSGMIGAGGCQSVEVTDGPETDMVEVPLSFMVSSSSGVPSGDANRPDADTRSARTPSLTNLRDLYVDRIQVNVYSRPISDYADDESGFAFDRKIVLPCREPASGNGDRFRYAFENVKLQRDLEYRMTAVGYSDQKGERNLFDFSETGGFSDASLVLTNESQCVTPELFFGTVYCGYNGEGSESEADVFAYKKGMILTGWLYRCVAGIELTLVNVPEDVTEIALLSGSMSTACAAICYDDFIKPYEVRNVPEQERASKYELAVWRRPDGSDGLCDATLKDANLLPVSSALSVRFIKGGSPYLVTLQMSDSSGSSGQEEDLAKGIVEFKRNHYYMISGEFQALATQKLFLSLTVNPNWEADADLELSGK